MYRLKIIILLLAVIPSTTLANPDSTRLNFYPLNLGNKWTYQYFFVDYLSTGFDTSGYDTINFEVLYDTLMPNGKEYFYISGWDGGFRRVDSLALKVYQYGENYWSLGDPDSTDEFVVYDLAVLDTFYVDMDNLYGEIRTSKFEELVGLTGYRAIQTEYLGAYYFHRRVLADGFGLSCLEFSCIPPVTVNELIRVKIDGIYYPPVTKIERGRRTEPVNFSLNPSYPNPFNSSTTISYQLDRSAFLELTIFAVTGELVCQLVNQLQEKGKYSIVWNGTNTRGEIIRTGVYVLMMKTDDGLQTQKMLLIH
ncbi:T9SS type A sorting domain-containing protein [candidate division KSB1 bacterium]|nr:T9SS type A sorting domain-containing protein [candidate division KSB1 bacterium]